MISNALVFGFTRGLHLHKCINAVRGAKTVITKLQRF